MPLKIRYRIYNAFNNKNSLNFVRELPLLKKDHLIWLMRRLNSLPRFNLAIRKTIREFLSKEWSFIKKFK